MAKGKRRKDSKSLGSEKGRMKNIKEILFGIALVLAGSPFIIVGFLTDSFVFWVGIAMIGVGLYIAYCGLKRGEVRKSEQNGNEEEARDDPS